MGASTSSVRVVLRPNRELSYDASLENPGKISDDGEKERKGMGRKCSLADPTIDDHIRGTQLTVGIPDFIEIQQSLQNLASKLGDGPLIQGLSRNLVLSREVVLGVGLK